MNSFLLYFFECRLESKKFSVNSFFKIFFNAHMLWLFVAWNNKTFGRIHKIYLLLEMNRLKQARSEIELENHFWICWIGLKLSMWYFIWLIQPYVGRSTLLQMPWGWIAIYKWRFVFLIISFYSPFLNGQSWSSRYARKVIKEESTRFPYPYMWPYYKLPSQITEKKSKFGFFFQTMTSA